MTHWVGSSPEERQYARGLGGTFQNVEEVDKFIKGLKSSRSSMNEVWPVHSTATWPEGLSLRREDLYEERV